MLWLCLIESMPNQKRNTSAEYTTRRLFTGLDCNKFYYIRFYNNSSTPSFYSFQTFYKHPLAREAF